MLVILESLWLRLQDRRVVSIWASSFLGNENRRNRGTVNRSSGVEYFLWCEHQVRVYGLHNWGWALGGISRC